MEILGIDIGGTGIKGAPVNTKTGEVLAPRFRLLTPQPSKPKAIASVVGDVAKHFKWQGPVGAGFPAVIQHGMARTAANIHKSWVNTDAAKLFSKATGCPVTVVNDADAAGIAEMEFGAGKEQKGVVLLVTIGTGLGTSVFIDGRLLPNTEFGHIEINCEDAELLASDAARKEHQLSWSKWAARLDTYLLRLEALIWPDLIILGGGVSKKHEKFIPLLTVQADVLPAATLNEAGIIGAALATVKSYL